MYNITFIHFAYNSIMRNFKVVLMFSKFTMQKEKKHEKTAFGNCASRGSYAVLV